MIRAASKLLQLIVINLEGALLLARVYQNTEPLRLAGAQLGALLRDEVPADAKARGK